MSDAEKTVRDLLEKVLNERGYEPSEIKIDEMSTGGTNYTTVLFLISVSLKNKDLKLFAKVANIGQELRETMNADWLYGTERFVYNKLVHIYDDLQKDLEEEHKFIFPEFFGCNDEKGKEAVIMENLVESGYKSYHRYKSMDWHHGRVGVENLARFHALSFALEKRDPEEFKKMTANMSFRIGTTEPTQSAMNIWYNMVERSVKVLREDYQDPVRKFLLQPNNFNKYNKPIGKPVISHGDYRLSNLLFKGQDDELKVKVVDYQTVHAGCNVADLIYYIFLGSDEEFRRLYYDKLLDHYYKSLEEALVRLTVDPVEVYPREKFDSDVKDILPYGMLLGVMLLPIVTVEAESAPKVDTDKADVSTFLLETNELYAERFRGVVEDCIRSTLNTELPV